MSGETWSERIASLHPRILFGETWAEADRKSLEYKQARSDSGLGTDWRPLYALMLAGVVLTFLRYTGNSATAYEWIKAQAVLDPYWDDILKSGNVELYAKSWWAGWRVIGYVVVPALFIRFVMKERVVDYGLSLKGIRDHAWIYVLCFVVVVVCVFGVSFDEAFQRKYPMYQQAGRSMSDLMIWECLYAAQFFALEFFFRGYWIKTCEKVMGGHAVTSMLVPYCMIHFGKPYAETIGAILAGLLLGTLVLRYRSIWAGVVVHISVAVSMDVLSLWQKGALPSW